MTSEHDTTLNPAEMEEEQKPDPYFGRCPECGGHDGFLNIRSSHWFICHAHRYRWCAGSNWFRCWREDTEADWEENHQLIKDYKVIPWVPELPDGPRELTEDEWETLDSCVPTLPRRRFEVGRVYATPGALDHLDMVQLTAALNRHEHGDWGDVCEEDRQTNDLAMKQGYRIVSSYTANDGTKFWVITEADRSTTTVLLPNEY